MRNNRRKNRNRKHGDHFARNNPIEKPDASGGMETAKIDHLIFTLILLTVFAGIYWLSAVPYIGVVAHWIAFLSLPALGFYLVFSLLMPGGEKGHGFGFTPLIWSVSWFPVFGWVFFLITIPAMFIAEKIDHLLLHPVRSAARERAEFAR